MTNKTAPTVDVWTCDTNGHALVDDKRVAVLWGPATEDPEVWYVRVGSEANPTRHTRQEGEALLQLAAKVAEAQRAGTTLYPTKTRLALLYDAIKGEVGRRQSDLADVHVTAGRNVTARLAEQQRAGWLYLTGDCRQFAGEEVQFWGGTPTGEMVLRLAGLPVPARRTPTAEKAAHHAG